MRRITLILGGMALLALLGGATYLGARLATRLPAGVSGVAPGLQPGTVGGKPAGGIRVDLTPAPQLPQTPPDESSLFVRRIGASVYISLPTVVGPGQEYEIVTSPHTVVYKDTTVIPETPDNPTTVQQILSPGRLDDIGEGAMVSAWGSRTCDRITATTLVYTAPRVLNREP